MEKKLGFGLMRLPVTDASNPASVDMTELKKMVDMFMESGHTYFDTAWMYNAFASEPAAKEALVSRYPRESYTLATKLNSGFFNSFEDRDKIFNAQLEKTGAGYFDYYLLHGLDNESYLKHEKFDTFNWLLEKKKAGLVKTAGFSYHAGAELLDQILTKHPEMEFVQLQINYLDWQSEAIQSKACYDVCVKHNKPVFVMEPAKGGTLARMPEKAEAILKAVHPDWSIASWAIRFAMSLDNVKIVLSGMSDLSQMEDNLKTDADSRPFTSEEQEAIEKVLKVMDEMHAIPCTGCSYCTDGCPMHIAIPKYFSLYNAEKQEVSEKGWLPQGTYYDNLTLTFGKASDCIECGQCEGMCPQHLPIINNLKLVAETFE